MVDELRSVFESCVSTFHDVTYDVVDGLNSQEILTTGGLFLCTMKRRSMACYRPSIILLLQNQEQILDSHRSGAEASPFTHLVLLSRSQGNKATKWYLVYAFE